MSTPHSPWEMGFAIGCQHRGGRYQEGKFNSYDAQWDRQRFRRGYDEGFFSLAPADPEEQMQERGGVMVTLTLWGFAVWVFFVRIFSALNPMKNHHAK